ncbi:DUF3540 domain-containing protein [Thalassobaculum sp.]|uniref:DUF3540 domain-containing protein n=1 Tax=Thalassobaculum sp. TaxID=2022740 RepID=UPI0032ECBDFC
MDGTLPTSLTRQTSEDQPLPFVAVVVGIDGDRPVIEFNARMVSARLAASCLLQPAEGDSVLAVRTAADVFVLAILERRSETAATLSVPGADSVTLAQPQLALRCDTLEVDAKRTTLRSQVAQVAGRTLSAVAERLDVVARTLRRSADHEFSHAKTASRTVEGAENITAGEMMLEARSALSQRAGIVLVDAREDVRVNGERITMG